MTRRRSERLRRAPASEGSESVARSTADAARRDPTRTRASTWSMRDGASDRARFVTLSPACVGSRGDDPTSPVEVAGRAVDRPSCIRCYIGQRLTGIQRAEASCTIRTPLRRQVRPSALGRPIPLAGRGVQSFAWRGVAGRPMPVAASRPMLLEGVRGRCAARLPIREPARSSREAGVSDGRAR